jgi:CRISPR-associated exonuclease Cas4
MPGDLITAGEIKNYGYCPRVVWYRRTIPGASAPTYKMKAGVEAQDAMERLEARRTLARYGLETAIRHRHLWLSSERLGINGRPDCVLESGGEGVVIDFKLTPGEPGENHHLQLAAYALLAEEQLGLTVARGFLYRIPDDRVFEIAINEDLRQRLRAAIVAIRQFDELPGPTPVRTRCRDCEYANFCADVW